MTIKSSKPGATPEVYPQSAPLSHKSAGSVQYDHRNSPAENQGLLSRMDTPVDDSDYSEMVRSAAIHPSYNSSHDAGADWAQDEFERRHDRRWAEKNDAIFDSTPRVDSGNFPASKDW